MSDCSVLGLPLETERLVMRDFADEDFDEVYELCTLPETCRYIRPAMTRDQVWEHIQTRKRPWTFEDGRWFSLVVTERNNPRIIGEVVFRYESTVNKRAEIGYRFHPDIWGRGFAFEAVDALTRVLFQKLDLHKIGAYFLSENLASKRLLDKLGMQHEGTKREDQFNEGQWRDSTIYGLLRDEYFKKPT